MVNGQLWILNILNYEFSIGRLAIARARASAPSTGGLRSSTTRARGAPERRRRAKLRRILRLAWNTPPAQATRTARSRQPKRLTSARANSASS